MPCYLTGSYEGDVAYSFEKSNEELAKKNTQLTRIACEAFQILEKQNLLKNISPASKRWWTAHKKIDAKRKGKK